MIICYLQLVIRNILVINLHNFALSFDYRHLDHQQSVTICDSWLYSTSKAFSLATFIATSSLALDHWLLNSRLEPGPKNPLWKWILWFLWRTVVLACVADANYRLICLVKKRKIRFRILSDLGIQYWIFLTKRNLNLPTYSQCIMALKSRGWHKTGKTWRVNLN